jgi:hypothetical protein
MESFVLNHPEWQGKVVDLVINTKGDINGVATCAAQTKIPIVQDTDTGALWAALGVTAKGILVVDQNGVIVLYLPGGTFPNAQVETTVNDLLK